MLNNESIKFLKSINSITNSVVLSYPITVGKTESADIAYMFDMSKFDTDGFDTDLGIYNLSSFLNVFSLFDDSREVNINNNSVSISDKNTRANYLLSSSEILNQFTWNKAQFDKSEQFPTVLEIDFDSNDIKKLKNASSVFSELDTLILECNENTTFSLTTAGEFKQSSNSFSFTKPQQSTKNFKVGISLETIFKIPLNNYKFIVKYNEARNAYRILLESENLSMIVSAKNV